MAKVLLLEDDLDLCDKITQYLGAKSHIVESLSSGDQAWLHLQTYGYDVLVIDWNVPGLNGRDLCQRYRKSGGMLPILMITARTEVQDLEMAFAAGADDYLKKPFTPDELLCRLLAVLRRNPRQAGQISHVGNLTFHHESRELFAQNKPIALQPQESAILDYLIKNKTWATAGELAERIGENNTTIESIRTSIMTLRKKITANGGTPVILTSRGEGYMVSNDNKSAAE
jgi:two-component system response regulator TctD